MFSVCSHLPGPGSSRGGGGGTRARSSWGYPDGGGGVPHLGYPPVRPGRGGTPAGGYPTSDTPPPVRPGRGDGGRTTQEDFLVQTKIHLFFAYNTFLPTLEGDK